MRGIQQPLAFLFCMLLTGPAVLSQPVDITKEPVHKKYILDGVISRLVSEHYAPRPIDDKYAQAVWTHFIDYLDSNRILFLKEDIDRLTVHRQTIDEQLTSGSAAFFDAVMAIYTTRVAEVQLLYPAILSGGLQLEKKEFYTSNRKTQPFPAGREERKEVWRKMLKYEFLKRYIAAKQGAKQSGLAVGKSMLSSLETKISNSIRLQYDAAFSQQPAGHSVTEKFYQYVNIVCMQMDPHSNFILPDINRAPPGFDGKPYYSPGITLRSEGTEHFIQELITGSAAQRSGQELVNHRIISIGDSTGNMTPVSGKSPLEVSHLLSGKEGTEVQMLIANSAMEEKMVSIPREAMRYNSYRMKSAIFNHNGKKTGYIYFPFFYGTMSLRNDMGVDGDLRRELAKLNGLEVEALVIDLRGNPGGSTSEAEWMLGDILGKGDVAVLKGKFTQQTLFNNENTQPLFKGPVTVMLDESSASSSELFAAAIQDHGRGILIGTAQSFGKGTAQTTAGIVKKEAEKTVINYGTLKVTEKKFYRINGISTQFQGVRPDIVIQQRMSNTSIREIDYPTALTADTLKVENYTAAKRNFDYDLVVKKATERIGNNTALQLIGSTMQQLEKLQSSPCELTVEGFEARTKAIAELETTLKKARELNPDKLLQVESSLPPWINPDTLLPFEHLQYEHWLNSLTKDIYIAEALRVTEDMMLHSK